MEENDEVIEYMINREWEKESKIERKRFLFNIAKESKDSEEISQKIGGMLIFNQIAEQLLKEVIICSIGYLKAEIWPTSIEFNLQLTKCTFGKLIEYFKQLTIKEYNREILIECLEKLNKNRNDMVHKLFDIENIDVLKKKLNEYDELSEETIELLLEYYNAICERLIELDGRVDFKSLI